MLADTTIYLPEDIECAANVTILGMIPEINITNDALSLIHIYCGKQQTIKQQLQYDHCFSPLSLRANRAYAPIFFASYCGS